MLQCQAVDVQESTDLIDVLHYVADVPSPDKHTHDPAARVEQDVEPGTGNHHSHGKHRPQQDVEGLLGHVINDKLGGLQCIDCTKDGIHCRGSGGSFEAAEQHDTPFHVDSLQGYEVPNRIPPAQRFMAPLLGGQYHLCMQSIMSTTMMLGWLCRTMIWCWVRFYMTCRQEKVHLMLVMGITQHGCRGRPSSPWKMRQIVPNLIWAGLECTMYAGQGCSSIAKKGSSHASRHHEWRLSAASVTAVVYT